MVKDFLGFCGNSDDIVSIDGWYRDEIGYYDRTVRIEIGPPTTSGIAVMLDYGKGARSGATWSVAFAPLDEDVACSWPVRFDSIGNGKGYSFGLIVECPEGTPLRAWRGDEEYVLE